MSWTIIFVWTVLLNEHLVLCAWNVFFSTVHCIFTVPWLIFTFTPTCWPLLWQSGSFFQTSSFLVRFSTRQKSHWYAVHGNWQFFLNITFVTIIDRYKQSRWTLSILVHEKSYVVIGSHFAQQVAISHKQCIWYKEHCWVSWACRNIIFINNLSVFCTVWWSRHNLM